MTSTARSVVFACGVVAIVALAAGGASLVVGSATGGAPSASDSAPAVSAITIESVTYGGDGVVTTPGDRLHLWRSDDHEFAVRVRTTAPVPAASVCLVTGAGEERQPLACRNVSFSAGSDRTVAVAVDDWPRSVTGDLTVAGVVRNRSTGASLAEYTLSVTVLRREADGDDDGLTNEAEISAGTDIDAADTDGDGLSDAVEVENAGTSPTDADTDADGLSDGAEVSVHHTDPTVADTDDDGLVDGREVELGTVPTRADTDGDGLDDGPETNRYQTNATNVDTDGDGLADGPEVTEYETNPTERDTDGDGLLDGAEVTLYGTNPTRIDTDGDGLSDTAEVTDHYTDPTVADTDGDGLDDADEVRDHGTDPLAADTDSDGVSDGLEVDLGSDPADPSETADPGLVRRAFGAAGAHPLPTALAGLLVLGGAVGVAIRRYDGRLAVGSVSDALRGRDAGDDAAAAGSGPTAGPSEEAADPDSPGVDLAVMTNEERVQHLLDANDGRMLQSDVVEAADWSKATVSRVLSRMEDEGTVTRVDIGKGNLVARPGDEPANANSPFSE